MIPQFDQGRPADPDQHAIAARAAAAAPVEIIVAQPADTAGDGPGIHRVRAAAEPHASAPAAPAAAVFARTVESVRAAGPAETAGDEPGIH